MDKQQFIDSAVRCVKEYLAHPDRYGQNSQLQVNPETKFVSMVDGYTFMANIEHSDEAIEAAAAVDGDAAEDAGDYQASQDPDFYAVDSLLKVNADGLTVVNEKEIEKIADLYQF